MPDLDVLIDLSDLYKVDLREILGGERKNEQMNEEMKETVLQVAEYSNKEKERTTKVVTIYFVAGIIALIVNVAMSFLELEGTFWTGFLEGATIGLALGTMILGLLYTTGRLEKVTAFKKRLIGRQ